MIYVAVSRGKIEIYDTEAMLSVTKNLVDHWSLTTVGSGWSLGPVSTPYSPYGIGTSVLAVPAYALSKWTGHFSVIVSLVAPAVTAGCVGFIYAICRALQWRPLHAVVAALSFGLLSMAVWYTVELFSEPAVSLCALVIVYGMVRWRQGHRWAPLWIGLAAACALQFRSDSLFTIWIMLAAVPLFVPWRTVRSSRSLALVGAPMALSLGLLIWYNEFRYGKPLIGGYGPEGSFGTPLAHGLRGLLLSPGKSLFVFNPMTLLGVVGLALLFFVPGVRDRPLAVVATLAVVPRILFFSKWGVWDAGAVWGPRFLLPSVAVLSVTIVPVLRATEGRRLASAVTRTGAVLLALWGTFVNVLSVLLPLGEWLSIVGSPALRAQFGIHGLSTLSAQQNAEDFSVRYAPIWGYVTILQHGIGITSADLWAYGNGDVGWILLAFGGILLGAAVVGSRSVPRRAHTAPRSRRSAEARGSDSTT